MPELVKIDDGSNPTEKPLPPSEEEQDKKIVEEAVKEVEEEVPGELADDEEYWPGGPTGAKVKEWKAQYGDVYVTSITPEKHIVWRTMTRFEYRRLVKALDQQTSSGQVSSAEANLNNEESMAETVILFPPYQRNDPSGHMAGVASVISQEVMEASGFVALEIRKL